VAAGGASHAPAANVIGVAALSPASELPAIIDAVKDEPVGKILGSYVMAAYSATYPDVEFDEYVGPGAPHRPLVVPAAQRQYVERMCDAGQRLEHRTYAGFDHVGVVIETDSPLVPGLLPWTQDRLDGKPQPPGCRRIEG
jgi:hypothetical protein